MSIQLADHHGYTGHLFFMSDVYLDLFIGLFIGVFLVIVSTYFLSLVLNGMLSFQSSFLGMQHNGILISS